MPPRGPLKWRWLTEMLAKLSKAAGILSPDGSVQINPTTGGVTLRATSAPSVMLEIESLGNNRFKTPELYIEVDDITFSSLILEEEIKTIFPGQLLCIRVEYSLTTETGNAVPRFFTQLTFDDIEGSVEVSLATISPGVLPLAEAASPQGPLSGLVYIPIAVHDQSLVVLARSFVFRLKLYHGQHQFSDL